MNTAPAPYVARSPDDLIALVPYLLGFHPEESLVLLTFGAGDGSFHARVDLPTDDVGRRGVVEVLVHAVRANRVPRAAVVVFTGRSGDAATMVERLTPALAAAHVDLVDAVRADGACWWSLLGVDPRCGHPYDLSSHPFTADRVFEGQMALRSRADVAAGIRHPDTPAADRDTAAIALAADRWVAELVSDAGRVDRLRSHAAWLADRLGTWVEEGPVAADDAARALVLVGTAALREVACVGLVRRTAPGHVELWRGLIRRAPDDLVPGAAGVLALAAWLAGDGALAWCAIDRCQEVHRELAAVSGCDPTPVTLVDLVGDLLHHAVPPTTWQPLRPRDLPLLADAPLDEAS